MATKKLHEPFRGLLNSPSCRCRQTVSLSRFLPVRFLTTETISPAQTLEQTYAEASLSSTNTKPILQDTFSSASTLLRRPYQPPKNPFVRKATCTIHAFPSFEPLRQTMYDDTALLVPLRKDVLHRAVIFEGDATRQGTASTKWRGDVHGSNHKIRPQKGTGSARLGDKKSPMLRGGGVAFGPKPRDFSTDLPKKLYDLAWRVALSYRYKRGELLLIDGAAEIERSGPGSSRWTMDMLRKNGWGQKDKRSLFVTMERRENFFTALEGEKMDRQARALVWTDVDVKDLLETGRVIIEEDALHQILKKHDRR